MKTQKRYGPKEGFLWMEALYVMGMFELDESVERICLVQLEGRVIDGQDI